MSKWQKLDRQDRNELVQFILGTAVMVFFVAYLYGGVKAVEGSGRWLYPLYMSLGWIVWCRRGLVGYPPRGLRIARLVF